MKMAYRVEAIKVGLDDRGFATTRFGDVSRPIVRFREALAQAEFMQSLFPSLPLRIVHTSSEFEPYIVPTNGGWSIERALRL